MMAKKTGRSNRSVVTARRGPSLVMIVGIVVVLLFAGVVGFGVYRTQHQTESGAIPVNATASGVTVGQASAPAAVDIYLDFQCPVCRGYEQQSGPTLDSLIASGAAKVTYHPLAFLDRSSSTKYSTRASEAAGCAAQDGPAVFAQYVKLLYANQPPEGGDGLPESQLISLGQQAGAGANFAGCVSANTFAHWTAALTDAASKAGIDATPTVEVNGKQIDNTDAALRQAVAAAK
ncbi:MAG TPA: thioredoxin domain-containing protein [Pseudonocardia sp.]|jgi:protein-disulfide isomerase|nr:thioredoxin domain-containing protein [Pseudonocardia sp.]